MNEHERLRKASEWYPTCQLEFDKRLIEFRYRALAPHLQGPEGLELGPADGVMTRFLRTHFVHLTIVDGAKDLLSQIPDYENVTKVHSIFEDFKPATQFDSIILEHILEHVQDPLALLEDIKGWAKPSGAFFIGVPNAWSFHRLAGVKMGLLSDPCELNARDHIVGHRRVYTPVTFRALLERAGFSVRKMGGVYLKPLSNQQIENTWSEELIQAFYELGHDFPENAAELFAVCTR